MKKLGLALGVGGAAACSHIGVIKALEEAKIPVHCVTGSSMGALIGGIYAAGHLKEFETYLNSLKLKMVLAQFDPAIFKNGMFKGERIIKMLDKLVEEKTFNDCPIPFTAIATDLKSGDEIRLNEGKISKAIRASIGIPGIFTTCKEGKYDLLDGGITNPLPIDVAREMGADIVLGVDLTKYYVRPKRPVLKRLGLWGFRFKYPTMIDSIEGAIFTMQKLISEKNLKEHPADVLLNLKLTPIGFFEFQKTKKLIEEAYRETKKILPGLKKLLK